MSVRASRYYQRHFPACRSGKRTFLSNLNPAVTVEPFLCRQMTAVTDRKGGIHENTTVLQQGIR